MFLKQPKNRQFSFSPRFYKPDEDEEENKRIQFRRLTARAPIKRRPFWWLFIMIVIIIFLIVYVNKTFRSDKEKFLFEDMKIEIVE